DPAVPLPIECGAEFIHGEAPETHRVLRRAGLAACAVGGVHLHVSKGRWRPIDYWAKIDRVLERIDADRPDESFAAFLAGGAGGQAFARDRRLAREFVQGFHAADVTRIGVHSIAPEPGEAASATASRLARVVQGYGALPRALARGLGSAIRLRTRVTSIAW